MKEFESEAAAEAKRLIETVWASPESVTGLQNEIQFIAYKLSLYANIVDTESFSAMSDLYVNERVNDWKTAFDYFDAGIQDIPRGHRLVLTTVNDIPLHTFSRGAYDFLTHHIMDDDHPAGRPLVYEELAPNSMGNVVEPRPCNDDRLPPYAYANFGGGLYVAMDDLACELRNGGSLEVLDYKTLSGRIGASLNADDSI